MFTCQEGIANCVSIYFGSNPRNVENDKTWKHTAIKVSVYTDDFRMERIVVIISEIAKNTN
jgi:hypothetical protein